LVSSGIFISFLVAKLEIPAFDATLASWLKYRGAIQLITPSFGTIIFKNKIFNALSNDFIPDIPNLDYLPGFHKSTLILSTLVIVVQGSMFTPSAVTQKQWS